MLLDDETPPAAIGIVGAGRLGTRLASSLASTGTPVAVYGRDARRLEHDADRWPSRVGVVTTGSLSTLVGAVARPRTIVLTVTAGPAVDELIDELHELLAPEDVVVDMGNSHYLDTARRQTALEPSGVRFAGAGVIPAPGDPLRLVLTAGGDARARATIEVALAPVTARSEGEAFSCWVGDGGSGHFVKMAHNGVEYVEMACLAEGYHLLRHGLGLGPQQIADAVAGWERGPLAGSMVSLTAEILAPPSSPRAGYGVDEVDDAVEQLGTGKWAASAALDLGTPSPTMAEAVFARSLSARRAERQLITAAFAPGAGLPSLDGTINVDDIRDALVAARVIAIAQGHLLLRDGADTHGWALDLPRIARAWNAGRVLGSVMLGAVAEALRADPDVRSTLLLPPSRLALERSEGAWRRVVAAGARSGVPLPSLSSALAFYDGFRSPRLPTALTQLQRGALSGHKVHRTAS